MKRDMQTIGYLLLGVPKLFSLFHNVRPYIVTQILYLLLVADLLFPIITGRLLFHNNAYVEILLKTQPYSEKGTLRQVFPVRVPFRFPYIQPAKYTPSLPHTMPIQ